MADVAGENAHPRPFQINRSGNQWETSTVPSSGAEDAVVVALRIYIQELHAKNEDGLSHRDGNTKFYKDMLLNLCVEKKKRNDLDAKVK